MDIPNYSLPIFLDLISLCRVSMIQNAIRKANKKRLSNGKKIDAVYALPDWEIMILLPLLQQMDTQM
jgi:hypothetical protein